MNMTMKELKIHTLRGDIQQIGRESSYNRNGIRAILARRYVNQEGEITRDEFEQILAEEYSKIVAHRTPQTQRPEGTYHTVILADGRPTRVFVPSKEYEEDYK